MVSAKRVQAYTGLEGFWKTAFLENDFKDDLLPFISYTDLLRRGHTFARYREKTLPPLSAAVRDVFEAVDASKKLKDEIERAKRDLENMDRKGLIEGFQ
jgi:hypothetical protein